MMATDDQPGKLASLMQNLKEHNVDLAGLWGFGVGQGRAQIILVPKSAEKFAGVASTLGLEFEEGSCFRVESSDELGVFVELFGKAAEAEINLHAVDALSIDGKVGCYIWCDKECIDSLGGLLGV